MAAKRSAWDRASQNVNLVVALLVALSGTKGLNVMQLRALLNRVKSGVAAVEQQAAILEALTQPIEDPSAETGK